MHLHKVSTHVAKCRLPMSYKICYLLLSEKIFLNLLAYEKLVLVLSIFEVFNEITKAGTPWT